MRETIKPPYVLNVGLPRTGTSSFATATRQLGLKALHIWHDAEYSSSTLIGLLRDSPSSRQHLSGFATLSDTPFYALRETFDANYPDTTIIYTTREKDGWVQSMLAFGTAGGNFLAQMYGISSPRYSDEHKGELEYVYDKHHEIECEGLAAIHLEQMSDEQKWQVLCNALPNSVQLSELVKGLPWPHINSSAI